MKKKVDEKATAFMRFFASMGVKFIDGNGEDILNDSDYNGTEQD